MSEYARGEGSKGTCRTEGVEVSRFKRFFPKNGGGGRICETLPLGRPFREGQHPRALCGMEKVNLSSHRSHSLRVFVAAS